MNILRLTFATTILATLVGCAGIERSNQRARAPNLRIGMTAQEALESNWGEPRHINKTVTAHGVREQWVYRDAYGSWYTSYIYLTNGIVTAAQP